MGQEKTGNSWVPLKAIPREYNEAMEKGVFNNLKRVQRDVLLDRFEEPRLSLTQTAKKHEISVTHAQELESKGLAQIRQLLQEPFPKEGDFLLFSEQLPEITEHDVKVDLENCATEPLPSNGNEKVQAFRSSPRFSIETKLHTLQLAEQFNLMHLLTPHETQIAQAVMKNGFKLGPISAELGVSKPAISKSLTRGIERLTKAIQVSK